MQTLIFNSKLSVDGKLTCPIEFAHPKAKFKVVATLPDEVLEEFDIDLAAITDVIIL